MVKLCSVLVLVICVNFSCAYFGHPEKTKHATTVASSIRAVIDRLAVYKSYFFLACSIEKDESQTGSTIYVHVLTLLDSYTTTIADFLKSLGESANTAHHSPAIIIANTEKLITQLIEKESIKNQINNTICSGGDKWFHYLPKFGPISDQITNDLRTIFGAFIVVCDSHRTTKEVETAEQKMILKLQNLLVQLTNLNAFYAKIKAINDYVDRKVADFNSARGSYNHIFDDFLNDYNEHLHADEKAILTRNRLHSKAFKSGMMEKPGSLIIDIDNNDGNIIINRTKFIFTSRYLTPIQQKPSHLKTEVNKVLALINNSMSHIPRQIEATKRTLIKTLYNTAKNHDIVHTYDCIISKGLNEHYNKIIAEATKGLKTAASFSYFAVVPFSAKILSNFNAKVCEIIDAIRHEETRNGAKNAFEAVRL